MWMVPFTYVLYCYYCCWFGVGFHYSAASFVLFLCLILLLNPFYNRYSLLLLWLSPLPSLCCVCWEAFDWLYVTNSWKPYSPPPPPQSGLTSYLSVVVGFLWMSTSILSCLREILVSRYGIELSFSSIRLECFVLITKFCQKVFRWNSITVVCYKDVIHIFVTNNMFHASIA